MSACHRGGSIFILKVAFKNINQAQQNKNRTTSAASRHFTINALNKLKCQ